MEDEEVVNYAIKNYGVKIENINLKLKNAIMIKNTNGCTSLKIIPNEIMEGFYVAKLVKL